METLTRKGKDGEVEHTIYTVDEARDLALAVVPWREALSGDWAETDDGYVARCLARREYTSAKKHTAYLLVFPFASVWLTKYNQLRWEERRATGYFGPTNRSWLQQELSRSRTKKMVRVYVKQFLAGKLDYKVLGDVYRKDQKRPELTVKRLLKYPEVKQMIDKELDRVLQAKGITKEFMVDTLKKAVEIAEREEDAGTLLKAVDRLVTILQVGKDIPRLDEDESLATSELLTAIAEERKRIGGTR